MPLSIHIEGRKIYDETRNKFLTIKSTNLVLEHSLISISKWESKWHIRYLDPNHKFTPEQASDYIRCMVVTPKEFDPNFVLLLTAKQSDQIKKYIEDPMSATTFPKQSNKRSNEGISSELIYYWMFGNQIPKECEQWHLNRLLNLIRIFGIKNDPKASKRMKINDITRQNDAINEARRKQLGTKG